MEIILAALITALAAVAGIVAKHADVRVNRRLEAIEASLATNGTNKTVGELAELLYADLQETKRDLSEHQRRTDAHGLQLWETRGR